MISREGRKTSSDKERAGDFLFESFVTDFAESLYERHRKTENFRSINDLGNYVRKE